MPERRPRRRCWALTSHTNCPSLSKGGRRTDGIRGDEALRTRGSGRPQLDPALESLSEDLTPYLARRGAYRSGGTRRSGPPGVPSRGGFKQHGTFFSERECFVFPLCGSGSGLFGAQPPAPTPPPPASEASRHRPDPRPVSSSEPGPTVRAAVTGVLASLAARVTFQNKNSVFSLTMSQIPSRFYFYFDVHLISSSGAEVLAGGRNESSWRPSPPGLGLLGPSRVHSPMRCRSGQVGSPHPSNGHRKSCQAEIRSWTEEGRASPR